MLTLDTCILLIFLAYFRSNNWLFLLSTDACSGPHMASRFVKRTGGAEDKHWLVAKLSSLADPWWIALHRALHTGYCTPRWEKWTIRAMWEMSDGQYHTACATTNRITAQKCAAYNRTHYKEYCFPQCTIVQKQYQLQILAFFWQKTAVVISEIITRHHSLN